MRHFLIVAGILVSSVLAAQKKPVQNAAPHIQNEPPVQQMAAPNCFEKNYDAGLSNIRRGDYRNALRILEDALNCPDAVVSSRRMNELNALIASCRQKLNPVSHEKSETTGKTSPRRATAADAVAPEFVISAALRNNTDPNCFQLTVREANRAFRDSAWEAAAKLYRAAKNCEDANQNDRESMNGRIAQCEAAAKDVLLQKEQKAIRLARHATASNLAAQAMTLLRQGNRSLAFRLADFANFYIAPDDNPDCLEAMYAAFFNAQAQMEGQTFQLPFCYQLSGELGADIQLKFVKTQNQLLLKAYQPSAGSLYSWELPSMKYVEGYRSPVSQNPQGFDIAPDGSLLYFSDNRFYIENGQLTLDVPQVGKYCFSEENNFFFYQDVKDNLVRALPLSTAASYAQFRKNGNISRAGTQAFYVPCQANLQSLCARNEQIWMGYPDRIEVYDYPTRSNSTKPRMVWRFGNMPEGPIKSMAIYPRQREAIIAGDSSFYYYFLHWSPSGADTVNVDPDIYPGTLLATTPAGSDTLVTFSESVLSNGDMELTIASPGDKRILQRFVYQSEDAITLNSATLSPDGAWLATIENGAIRLLPLGDRFSTQAASYPGEYTDKLSADGEKLVSTAGNKLSIFDAYDMSEAPKSISAAGETVSLPKGESKRWVVYQSSPTQLELVQGDKKIHIPCQTTEYDFHSFAFDDTEQKYFACSSNDEVTVYSLPDGAVLTHKTFPGNIENLQRLPGSTRLLVVHASHNSFSSTSVKVWDVSDPNATPEPVHLEGYNVLDVAVSEQGDHVAFTDGSDIHVFSTGNWSNESLVINIGDGLTLNKIRFRSDGAALAGGCEGGEVFIWNIFNGRPILKFLNSWNGLPLPVLDLAFAQQASTLHLLSQGVLFSVPVDAGILHDYVLTENRWLKTFSPGQIREYGLETAFKYPGNLEKLAQSGDQLLIRSFLEFFREQSAKSYNIAQVSTYCNQAATFLDVLGESDVLRNILLQMYHDLVNKCLVRNNLKEARQQLEALERRFGHSPLSGLLQAHLTLLEGATENAARLYSDYLISTYQDDKFEDNLDGIEEMLLQFQDANLLDSARLACVCSVFQPFLKDATLCSLEQAPKTNSTSEQALHYREILLTVNSSAYASGNREKVQELEAAFKEASKLDYPNPVVQVHPLEFTAIALADAYLQEAVFEHNSPKTPQDFEKVVNLLEKIGPFRNSPDTARLMRLANAEFQWGNYLSLCSRIPEAITHFKKGIEESRKLETMFEDGALQKNVIEYQYSGPLYASLCEAYILEGNAAAARQVLEQGKSSISSDLQSTLSARAALLEKNDQEAFLEFGVLHHASEIGQEIYHIHRMAEQLPAERDYLNDMTKKLKTAFLSIHPRLRESEIDYYESVLQVEHFAAMSRFDSALVWAINARTLAQGLFEQSSDVDSLRNFFLAQCLNESYYQVMVFHADTARLSYTIHLIESAFSHINSSNLADAYYGTLLYTNLAHAYWLRNREGDRETAVSYYQRYLAVYDWEVLRKDFIDLHRGGVNWPDLEELLKKIMPDNSVLTPDDKREMGL